MRLPGSVFCFALALPLATACGLFKARSDPTRYFVLTSAAPRAPAAPTPVVLGVDHIGLPEYLMRTELVTRSASNQLKIAEYDHWGEPLKDGFSRTLRRDLEDRLGAGHVVVAPFNPTSRPALVVDVDVRRFEGVEGEGAVLEASWTIRDGKSGTALVTRDPRLRQPVAGPNPSATVAALSSALAALAGEIADAARAR